MTQEPLGINYVRDNYVMGIDCYWKNGTPVNEKYWGYFKELQDSSKQLIRFMGSKPMAFSLDFIEKAFNPVHHMITNAVLRDSVFAFRAFIKNLDLGDWLNIKWDENSRSFILYLPTHEFSQTKN